MGCLSALALPFGISPKNKGLAESGESGGIKYQNRAVLLVGSNPAPAPGTSKFNPLRLPRIQAYGGKLGSQFWLGQLRAHPGQRYISDGNAGRVSMPKANAAKIDETKLGAARLRIY